MIRHQTTIPDARRRRASWFKAAVTLLAIQALCRFSPAQVRSAEEVRAAYVFNLTKYVEWPGARNELLVGYIGDDDAMAETLRQVLADKKRDNTPIRFVVLREGVLIEPLDLLYVSYSGRRKASALLERLRGTPTLIVGDHDWFVEQGGMVGLVTAGDHVQIVINLQATEAGNLKISSRLLNLARIVRSGPRN